MTVGVPGTGVDGPTVTTGVMAGGTGTPTTSYSTGCIGFAAVSASEGCPDLLSDLLCVPLSLISLFGALGMALRSERSRIRKVR